MKKKLPKTREELLKEIQEISRKTTIRSFRAQQRNMRILELVVEGLTYEQIAKKVGLSSRQAVGRIVKMELEKFKKKK